MKRANYAFCRVLDGSYQFHSRKLQICQNAVHLGINAIKIAGSGVVVGKARSVKHFQMLQSGKSDRQSVSV